MAVLCLGKEQVMLDLIVYQGKTYMELLPTSTTTLPNQPLLTLGAARDLTTVTVPYKGKDLKSWWMILHTPWLTYTSSGVKCWNPLTWTISSLSKATCNWSFILHLAFITFCQLLLCLYSYHARFSRKCKNL